MRDDWRFEIDRAFDILPHAAGASWAAVWFRMKGQKRSHLLNNFVSKQQNISDCLDHFFPHIQTLKNLKRYPRTYGTAVPEETERILAGENDEIEKRYKRYLDYG